MEHHPLARYVAEHWWQHARSLEAVDDLIFLKHSSSLFSMESDVLFSWTQLYDFDQQWMGLNLSLRFDDLAQPLYYAAFTGLPELVEIVLSQTTNVNAQGGHYGNALQAASEGGHEKVMQMLMEARAERCKSSSVSTSK